MIRRNPFRSQRRQNTAHSPNRRRNASSHAPDRSCRARPATPTCQGCPLRLIRFLGCPVSSLQSLLQGRQNCQIDFDAPTAAGSGRRRPAAAARLNVVLQSFNARAASAARSDRTVDRDRGRAAPTGGFFATTPSSTVGMPRPNPPAEFVVPHGHRAHVVAKRFGPASRHILAL